MLIVFSGLPGSGKSTLARLLAARLDAVWLRIDSIEQGIRESVLQPASVEDAGYRAAYGVAADNLRLGRSVVADSVNPIAITRDAWHGVAAEAGVPCRDVEVVCSDQAAHRARVEGRAAGVPGLRLPTWADVQARDYEPWPLAERRGSERIVVDTAEGTPGQAVERLLAALGR